MHVHWMWAAMNARGQMGGTPCQFVSHTVPENRKKAKVSCKKVLASVSLRTSSSKITVSCRHGQDVFLKLLNVSQLQ